MQTQNQNEKHMETVVADSLVEIPKQVPLSAEPVNGEISQLPQKLLPRMPHNPKFTKKYHQFDKAKQKAAANARKITRLNLK